ncbi:MAG TPA: phosphopantetheine-binding protein, partial [Thermoanaerobaculia bacterium]|nr:phosphopantetheine-binding protein [Thermoanaerobaculia bacterium]
GYQSAREHWLRRIPHLPPPPELPLAVSLSPKVRSRISTRFSRILETDAWQAFKDQAARLGLTPSTPLIAAFLEVVRTWSRNPRYTLSLEGTYWPPIHPHISSIVGNFNTIYLVAADDVAGSFAERSRRLQDQLTDILDNRAFSGFEVLREINRRRGGSPRALMPLMFNSLIEFNHKTYRDKKQVPQSEGSSSPGQGLQMDLVELGGRPPQLVLMPAVIEGSGFSLEWAFRAVEEVFPPGVTQGLEEAYVEYVRRLSREPDLWGAPPPCLTPATHLAQRAMGPKPLSTAAARDLLGLAPEDRILALALPAPGRLPDELLRELAPGVLVLRPDASAGLTEEAGLAARASVWSGSPVRVERLAAWFEREGGGAVPRLVLLWGETVPVNLPDRLRALAPGVRVFALASFPEAGLVAALHEIGEVPDNAVRIPLGQLLGQGAFEILDERLKPRPDFVPGELYVNNCGKRLRTGRLALFLPNGTIELLGPEDEYTVDLFGYPAEPRQTEAALERLPGVRIAVARPVLDARGRRRLAAWVVPTAGATTDPKALRAALGEQLPAYLVPWRVRFLDELPLNAAGEIDHAALPADFAPDPAPVAPGELETGLARLWTEVLGIKAPGLEDNFFELGGTSFTAVLLLGRLQEQHGDVELSSFFYEPTITHLAGILHSQTLRGAHE